MNRNITILLLTMWCCATCMACVGAPLSAGELAVSRITSIAKENSDFTNGRVRYNPAKCDCPEYELLLSERWLRVEIINDDQDDPVAAALFLESARTGSGLTMTVRGKIAGVQKKKFRSPVLRLRVDEIFQDSGFESPDNPTMTEKPVTGEGNK